VQGGLGEEAEMKRIQITKPKARRQRPWHEPLLLDPRDLDIVRAKETARAATSTHRKVGRT
jgi:hypothetical protein